MSNGYVIAGYGLIWATLLLYAWRVARRVRVAERELAATGGDAGADVES